MTWIVTGRSGEILSMVVDHGQDLSGLVASGIRRQWAGLFAELVGYAPGQEFVDAIDFMVSYVGQYKVRVNTRIDAVQLAGANQRIHRGGTFATRVSAGEQIVADSITRYCGRSGMKILIAGHGTAVRMLESIIQPSVGAPSKPMPLAR